MTSVELVHYGVKGMKWGVRRAELDKPNSNYSERKRAEDRAAFGKRGEKRINRRLNSGKTHKQATRREYARIAGKAVVTSGIATTIVMLDIHGKHPATYVAKRAETKRGQAAAAASMGLPRTASTGPKYTKPNRKGVYNISSL